MKRILKILSYTILSIFGLIIMLLIISQTSWFRNIIKNQVVSIANEQLNGTLSIGELEGDFFTNIHVSGIRIEKNDTTILYTEKLSLDYTLSGILFKSIKINVIRFDSIYVFLKQERDSSWNIANLLKGTEEEEEPDNTESSFDWNIGLGLFEIARTELKIVTNDTSSVIPRKLYDINFSASAELTPSIIRFIVKTLTLKSYMPNFEIVDLDLKSEITDEKVEIESFILKSTKNKIDLNAKYFPKNSGISTISFITDPIDIEEFSPILPELVIQEKPVLKLEGTYENNTADIDLFLMDEIQSIILSANVDNLNSDPNFKIDLNVDSFQIGKWTADKGISSLINGVISVNGTGTSFQTFDANAEIILAESKINNIDLDTLRIIGSAKEDDLLFSIFLDSEFGNLLGDIDLQGMENERIYAVELNGSKLNISPIFADQKIDSDMNFLLSIKGKGFDPNSLYADLSFYMKESSIMDYSISSINSRVKAEKGIFNINNMNFVSDYADLNVSGILSPTKRNSINFDLIPKNISSLPQINEIGNISLDGKIEGSSIGYFDSLSSAIEFSLSDILYEEYRVKDIEGKIDLLKEDNAINIYVAGELSDIDLAGLSINRVGLDAEYGQNLLRSEVTADINDTSKVNMLSEVVIDSLISILVEDFNFEISDYKWENLNDSLLILIDGEKYSFSDFELSNGQQSISIKGYLDQKGTNDLNLEIKKLDIGELVNILRKDLDVGGKLNADIRLLGDLSKPNLKGNLGVYELNYKNELFGRIDGDISLKDEKLQYEIGAEINENRIESDGNLPIKLNRDDSTSIIPKDVPLDINLKIDIPTLAPFAKYIEPVDKLDGAVRSQLKISNSLNDLDMNGFFRIDNSELQSDLYGLEFNDIDLNFEAENKSYFLRKFYIGSGEGKLSMDGVAEFNRSPLDGRPDKVKLVLEANEFDIANSRNLEARIDGKINFEDVFGNTKFSGDMTLLRSRVYLPFFMESASGKVFDESKPLLMKELEKSRKGDDTIKVANNINVKDSVQIQKFMKNISGRFRLNIPKNTWIVSPDINIELSGEVDIVKEGDFFELYGNMQTVRGKLALLGKELKVIKGQIIFDGGAEFDPGLNIQLQYLFRSSNKVKRNLELILTGTVKSPKLNFEVDDIPIDEGNAISYLLFGKSLDELSQGQKSNVKNSNEDLAKTIAGNLVAAQLKNTLGDALGLDVIEIRGENNWQQASLTAGKYLTDDLYVSYEKGFGNSETNEVNPSIVTLEYGLTEFLFFQLVEGNDKTAGFDFIFKFDF